jgi:hypothetical protein
MQRKSQGSAEPLSTHSSIQILANEHSLPDVRAHWSVGSDAGEMGGVLFLTVEAEHRTGEFDHTATFTISGTPTAIDRVLLALRAAYAAQIQPLLGE